MQKLCLMSARFIEDGDAKAIAGPKGGRSVWVKTVVKSGCGAITIFLIDALGAMRLSTIEVEVIQLS
jgi:hypothetical protein